MSHTLPCSQRSPNHNAPKGHPITALQKVTQSQRSQSRQLTDVLSPNQNRANRKHGILSKQNTGSSLFLTHTHTHTGLCEELMRVYHTGQPPSYTWKSVCVNRLPVEADKSEEQQYSAGGPFSAAISTHTHKHTHSTHTLHTHPPHTHTHPDRKSDV